MRNKLIWGLVAASLCAVSCAEDPSENIGELNKAVFDAWIQTHKEAGWQETELGSWIITLDEGDIENQSIASVDENPYLRITYTVTDVNGKVTETTDEAVSKRIGEYSKRNWYGPRFTYRVDNNTFAGVEEIFGKMGIGGHFKAVIPGWLLTTSRHDSKEAYIKAMTSSTAAAIYDVTIVESVKDVEEWEMNVLKERMGADWDKADSLTTGVYYVQDKASDKPDTTFDNSASVYINYICRRIDGTGIDTNLADSAKVFGITADGKARLINWGEKATDLTMGSDKTTVVTGFSYGIYHMKPHEKGRVYMTSGAAYGSSGSGSAIPAYCPIYFELEMVDNE